MIDIRLFYYRVPGLLIASSNCIDRIADGCAGLIVTNMNSGTPDVTLKLSRKYLDGRAQLHCDKWVEGTADHLTLYSAAQQPGATPLLACPPGPVPAPLTKKMLLRFKSFSGDISGVIGEALFSCVLSKHFKLSDTDFAHFRADKQTGIFPDFGIFNSGARLGSQLRWHSSATLWKVVPAEVKTVTTPEVGTVKSRLKKAFEQNQSFYNRVKASGVSIVCVALRNQNTSSYDVALIWGL